MNVVIVGPHARPGSGTAALVDHIDSELVTRHASVTRLYVCDLDLNLVAATLHGLLVDGETSASRQIRAALDITCASSILVVVTPIHKGSCSGVVKLFLDALPEGALQATAVLPVGVAGSMRSCSVLAYGLVPILHALGATEVVAPFCAGPDDWVCARDGGVRLSASAEDHLNTRVAAVAHTALGRPASGTPRNLDGERQPIAGRTRAHERILTLGR
jgi:NAD(P)H-dependent FMN reductase